ncbi:BnaCnng69920D [Brassica napus]|uniref:BnaC02g02950D protein n=1 Tax=Brassica napus TaxID=3708 RepID=A0A078JVM4_BRANA|nr:BnaC02g02950D [Brassica napus]CDY70819.1 BnaCnng69920D [Brassica napus]
MLVLLAKSSSSTLSLKIRQQEGRL